MIIPLTWGHELPARGRHDQRTARLLVVEDDERIRTAVIRALRDRGHAVGSDGTALRPASAAGRTEVTLGLGSPPA